MVATVLMGLVVRPVVLVGLVAVDVVTPQRESYFMAALELSGKALAGVMDFIHQELTLVAAAAVDHLLLVKMNPGHLQREIPKERAMVVQELYYQSQVQLLTMQGAVAVE
jgi:hypothetical protein